jgi:hypothetical protein
MSPEYARVVIDYVHRCGRPHAPVNLWSGGPSKLVEGVGMITYLTTYLSGSKRSRTGQPGYSMRGYRLF